MNIFDTLIVNPSFNLMLLLFKITGSLGFGIILFTILIKVLMIPITIPSLKMGVKQREIKPELDEIKKKYSYDKKKQAEMQMAVLKKHGINPTTGCLTTIITIVLLFAIYQSVTMITYGTDNQQLIKEHKAETNLSTLNKRIFVENLKFKEGDKIDRSFLYLDLARPDPYLILTILTVIAQFVSTKMIMPYVKIEEQAAKVSVEKEDDFMVAMQQQNQYVMPIMFFIFGITMPSGVLIYIFVSTLFQIIQTFYFSGWGGMTPWINKIFYVKKVQ